MLNGLLIQYENSKYSKNLALKIFIINTEIIQKSNNSFEDRLITTINSINNAYKNDYVWYFNSIMNNLRRYKNTFYGYDESDKLLDYLIQQVIH